MTEDHGVPGSTPGSPILFYIKNIYKNKITNFIRMAKKEIGEGIGISGFTLGIISIVTAGWLGLVLSVVGFSFCMAQQKKNPIKLGKAGIIVNIIGFVLSVAWIIYYITYVMPMLAQSFPVA
jgi:hypothetical protein